MKLPGYDGRSVAARRLGRGKQLPYAGVCDGLSLEMSAPSA
jgi:hypothetical protein